MAVKAGELQRPQAKRHAGVATIALMEAAKGLLALLVAAGLEISGPAPLRNLVHRLLLSVGADPEHGALASTLAGITPDTVHVTGAILLAYALLRGVEAWGLWQQRTWASWLGCISAAVYLPLDLYAIVKHPGWVSWLILAINLLVVGILAQDLRRRRTPPNMANAR